MPQIFKIDQAATFSGMILLSVEPKVTFGGTEQERSGDGILKWELQLVAGFRQFDKTNNEVLKVGLTSHINPGDGIPPYTPVELVGFEVGVMDKKNKSGEILGAQIWYRCSEIRSTAAVNGRRSHAEGS
jgi:hypothetical protein